MLHAFSPTLTLLLLWLLLSRHFAEPPWLAPRLVTVVVVIIDRMNRLDHERHPTRLSWRSLLYWPWRLKDIVRANIDLAKAVLRDPPAIEPTVSQVPASPIGALDATRSRSRLAA